MSNCGIFLLTLSISLASCLLHARPHAEPTGESVVFIHPDGAGLAAWNIFRIFQYGPDGRSHWDRLPGIAVYHSHMRDHLNASSHGGGTIHAYGVKVQRDSFGQDGLKKIQSASGYPGSLMQEAQAAGMKVGIVNSGHLAEPGTAAMLASVDERSMTFAIVAQLVASGADIILGGGEVLFLPKDVKGYHGQFGMREDGRNLIREAKAKGYTVIYTIEELAQLSSEVDKVLGLFAAMDTYNAMAEEAQQLQRLPHYWPDTPTVALMTEAALNWLSAKDAPFFLMVEEEGTDNFANVTNASGMLDAMLRADEAIGVASRYVKTNPTLSLLVAADSEASGPDIIDFGIMTEGNGAATRPLPARNISGSPMDGIGGTGTLPFVSAPDQYGQQHIFAISWIDGSDHFGGVLVRAEGPISEGLPPNVENTEIFSLIRERILEDG